MTNLEATPIADSSAAAELLFHAEYLDDIEHVRIASENRARAMSEQGIDATPYGRQVEALAALEHQAELALKRTVRKHPLAGWIKQTRGVGEKQAARLLAAVGDPLYNHADERPRRGVAEFWQYCGHGDPARSRMRKGEKVQFSPAAKMRAHLIAEAMLKAGNRDAYDRARESWADRECKDGHKHNHALRVLAKDMLKGLFLYAKEIS